MRAQHLDARPIFSYIGVNAAQCFADLRFYFWLGFQFSANAGGGLIQNFFQDGGVLALGLFGIDALQHLLEKRGNLLTFLGFCPSPFVVSFGLLASEISFLAEALLFFLRSDSSLVRRSFFGKHPGRNAQAAEQRQEDNSGGRERCFITAGEFVEAIDFTGRARENWLVV